MGRAIGKPNVCLSEENYKQPSLEWFQIHRGNEEAGELLAAFEMFEVRNFVSLMSLRFSKLHSETRSRSRSMYFSPYIDTKICE